MFLGEETDAILYRSGAFHHARWMAKAIYSLKIILVRNYLDLSRAEILKLIKVCEFIVFIYMETWFTAPLAISAPNNDMQFFKKLKK